VAVLLVPVVVLLLLQVPPVRTSVVNRVLRAVGPWEGMELRVRDTHGSVLCSLGAVDLSLVRSDGSVAIRIDSVGVDWSPFALLRRRVVLDDVIVVGPEVRARRDTSGAIDVFAPFVGGPDGPSAWSVHIRRLALEDGLAVLEVDTADVWTADRIRIELSELSTRDGLALRLDALGADIRDPGERLPGRLALRAAISDGALSVDTLLFRTARSSVTGAGTIRLPSEGIPATDSLRFRLDADSLSLADLAPLFPILNPEGRVRLGVDLRGTGRELGIRAEATTGAGGRVSADIATIVGRDSVAWVGRIDVDRLSPGDLLAGRPEGERLSGHATFRLVGPDAGRLSGPVRIEASATELGGFRESTARLEQDWTAGRAATRIVARAAESEVRVDGWMELLAEVPTYDLRIRTEPFTWDGAVRVRGAIEATLRGSGLDRSARADLAWRPVDARIGGCELAGEGGLLRLRDLMVRADAQLEHCGAPIRLEAALDLAGQRPWTLAALVVEDVPVAPVDTVAGRVSARVSGSGFFPPSGPPHGTFRLSDGSVLWAGTRLDSLVATIGFRGSDWEVDADGEVAGGTLSAHLAGAGPSVSVEEVVFARIDLSSLPGRSLPSTSLDGRAAGRIDWSDPAGLTGSFDVRIAGSRFAEQTIDSLRVDVDMEGGSGRLVASGHLHGGALSARASFRIRTDSTRIELEEGRFRGIDVAAWTGAPVATDLAGSARGLWADGSAGLTGRLDLALAAGSSVRGTRLESAAVEIRLDPDSTVATLTAVDERGGLIEGRFRMDADSTWTLFVRGDSLDAARFALADSVASRVDGSIRASGRGFAPSTADGLIEVDLRGFLGSVGVDRLTARARLEGGLIVVDSFRTRGTFGSLVAEGTIPVPGARVGGQTDLRGTLELRDAASLAAATGVADLADATGVADLAAATGVTGLVVADGTARFRVRGSERGLTVSVTAEAQGIAVRRVHVATLEGTVSAEIERDYSLRAAEVRLEAVTVSLPSTTAETINVLATIRPDTIGVEADVRFTERRQVHGAAVLTDSLRHVYVLSLEALLDDAEWSLVAPVDVELRDGFRLSGAVLQAGDQRIAAGGGYGPEGSDLYVTAQAVRLDAVASLLGYRGLGLVVDGAMTGAGSSARPQLNGVLEAAVSQSGRPAVDLVLAMTVADQVLQLDGQAHNASGGEALVQGSVSLEGEQFADAPVNLDISAEAMTIDWILPFLDRDDVSSIAGLATGHMEIRGTFDEPEITGEATLRDGRIGLPTLGRPGSPLEFSGIEADVTFENETVHVERASARSGPGSLRATGFITLEQLTLGRFGLDITTSDFLAIDDAAYRAYAAADLRLSGSTKAPILSGSARIARGEFFLAEEKTAAALEPVELDAADLLALEQRFGIRVTADDTTLFSFYDRMTIEALRLDFERDTWFRSRANPKMDVRFTGSLDVQKAPRTEPVVFGTITVVPEQSRIEQFGRRFEIDRGELTFSGPMSEPSINLAASYEVRSRGTTREEVTIRLVASGKPEDLRIVFASDPAMDLSDIISYIATGRPASSSLQFQGSGNGYLGTAAGLAIGPIAGVIEDVAGAGLGLDVIEIEHDGLSGLTLTAGKYVSPRFYVSVQQPISFATGTETTSSEQGSETQVSMEYEILRELLVSLLSRGAVLRVQLRWEHAF
jgi:translocation and assembly module TamB